MAGLSCLLTPRKPVARCELHYGRMFLVCRHQGCKSANSHESEPGSRFPPVECRDECRPG